METKIGKKNLENNEKLFFKFFNGTFSSDYFTSIKRISQNRNVALLP